MYPSKREKDEKSRRNYGVYLFTIAKRHFWEGLGIKRSTSRLQAVPIKSLCGASVWMQILEARSTGPEKTDDGEWSFFAMKSMGFVRKKRNLPEKNLWIHQTSGDFTCCANMYQSHRDLTYDFTGRDFIQWTRWEPPTTLVGWSNAISIGLAICVYTYRRFFWIFPDLEIGKHKKIHRIYMAKNRGFCRALQNVSVWWWWWWRWWWWWTLVQDYQIHRSTSFFPWAMIYLVVHPTKKRLWYVDPRISGLCPVITGWTDQN